MTPKPKRSTIKIKSDAVAFERMRGDLSISRFVARAVIVPMRLPLQTSTGAVARVPLLLIDCETDQGVIGHAYLFGIMPASLKPLVNLVNSMSELLAGDPLAPFDIERKLTKQFTLLGPVSCPAIRWH